ncbi:ribonuclease VapC [Alicycliphilus denitrificans]|jgi:tRNA(fMet)-specific endonuclease VapC|uniref:type II toxin-antitoxin system VapC family toxin n=1 Tax=Alicycliphilus denitrificans TaxID=179636 RepID=UPI00095E04FD|nr:type II toxin-antitoxin system VapC family toxin [Alicycliphilus denitrificans]MBN9576258.1 type II toxin-antitoxin system VapC family toxin [Alicycliphilus denitrificans]OJW85517.1 MAG: VapC toxin family PIN domain ribonuclease [Alicycliphilus sp. 69-12]BCN40750.1 ribonuclease VapC [Alicycliphilus denitrificans]
MNAPRYLLDTNILSDLVRHPQGIVARKIAEVGEAAVCTSIIAAAELRFGAAKRNSARLSHQVHAILSAIEVLALDMPADSAYAQLRWALEQSGRPIGPNGMLIAAQALAHECVLVTANVGEFSRIADLQVTNWLGEAGDPLSAATVA